MKKGRILIITLIVVGLLTGIVFAACNKCSCKKAKDTKVKCIYWGRHCNWMVKLKNGKLWVEGCKGTWKNKNLVIDNGVTKFWAVGTGMGPMVVYHQGNLLYVAYLGYDKPGLKYRDKFYKDAFTKVHLKGQSYGASISIVKPNKDVLIVWAGEKGYKYKRVIKYKK